MHVQTCLAEAELRARSRYGEPHRHYHDFRHLDDCLAKLAWVTDLTEHQQQQLRWAILWHDAVYDTHRTDNEEVSGELAYEELTTCQVDEVEAAEVQRLILLTKGHRVDANDRLGALLVSIDLAVLGADAALYSEYTEDVRREYAHVPDDAWRIGRSAVLEHLLAANPIFPDERFRSALEVQARRNLENELKRLSAS